MRIGLLLIVCVAILTAAAPRPSRPLSNATLQRILSGTEMSVDYRETPAREVFKHLEVVLGVPFRGRYDDDRVGHGINPAIPITLAVVDTPALTVVEQVLDQCEDLEPCTWQLRKGFVEVGTKERLSVAAAQEIRLYSIRDLMMIAPNFDNAPQLDMAAALGQASAGGAGGGGSGGGFGGGNTGGGGGTNGGSIISAPAEAPLRVEDLEFVDQLMDLLQATVEPDTWVDNGGTATMRYLSDNLVVRAPGFVHRQLGGSSWNRRAVPGVRR